MTALLVSSVYATGAVAQVEITIGGGFELNLGYDLDQDEGSGSLDDIDFTDDFVLNRKIVADNGLTFGARIDLDDTEASTDSDEPGLFVSGSFGSIRIGDDDGTIGNIRPPTHGAYDACGTGQGTQYFTPRFFGYSFGTGYVSDLEDRNRGALAFDQAGEFVNPALNFEYRLDGINYGIGGDFCIDTGRLLPTIASLGFEASHLSGSDEIGNLNFPNLGVTGVGNVPGILINAPTDVLQGVFDVDRNIHEVMLNIQHPVRINANGVREEFIVTPSGSGWTPVGAGPSIGVLSVVGGLRYGFDRQNEATRLYANTPAFGLNGDWMAEYHTRFKTNRYGAYVGLSSSRSFIGRNGGSNTLKLTGTVGYDFLDISVRDSVNATGLGGGLNYNNTQHIGYDEGLFTAALMAAYTWQRNNTAFQLSAGLEHGKAATYDYNRPDSNLMGALLPTLSVDGNTQFVLGATWSKGF